MQIPNGYWKRIRLVIFHCAFFHIQQTRSISSLCFTIWNCGQSSRQVSVIKLNQFTNYSSYFHFVWTFVFSFHIQCTVCIYAKRTKNHKNVEVKVFLHMKIKFFFFIRNAFIHTTNCIAYRLYLFSAVYLCDHHFVLDLRETFSRWSVAIDFYIQ